jgi:hypothetical protein
VVLLRVDNGLDRSFVGGYDGLVAGFQVDSVDVPVKASAEGSVVVVSEADVQDGGAVVYFLQQGALFPGACVVEVDIAIPRGD